MININRFVGRVIQGDAVDILSSFPDDCIDLVVTSPPYDNLRDYEGYTFDFYRLASQIWRIIKPAGVVVWVVGDATIGGSETGTSFRQALTFMDIGFNLHDTMIYQKKNIMPRDPRIPRYYQEFEYMFVFSKGRPNGHLIREKTKNAGAFRVGYSRLPSGELRFDRKLKNRGARIADTKVRGNVWSYAVARGEHPAPFPEKLARDHIVSWSDPGDVVLDPMCGSGTTLKAAIETGRQYIGIDISEKYCELARRRLLNAQLPIVAPVGEDFVF